MELSTTMYDLLLMPWTIIMYLPMLFGLAFVLIVFPACLGNEIGIRRLYIKLLMNIFNWATKRLTKENESSRHRVVLNSSSDDLIRQENPIKNIEKLKNTFLKSESFKWEDTSYLVKSGIEAIIDDKVTKRFSAEELPMWNLLTRTNYQYHFISRSNPPPIRESIRLSVLWFLGVVLRYGILFPLRVMITVFAMLLATVVMLPLSKLEESPFKRTCVYYANVVFFRICCRAFSAVITYHDRQNLPSHSGICVANHTTTLDVALLMQDRPYAVLGQIHGGYLGWLQRTLSNCAKHVWFERGERLQQEYVKKRLSEHVSDPLNYPLLIFPEGTCVNNSAVMMFKKGSFEVPTTIFPVAIKYNPWFGDAFWDSSKHSMLQYLAVVMTSWAIVADVWYLPPMKKHDDEDVLQFTERVQMEIMKKGGLIDCRIWDGQLKRKQVKETERKYIQNVICEIFSKKIENNKTLAKDEKSSSSSEQEDEVVSSENQDEVSQSLKRQPHQNISEIVATADQLISAK